MIVKRIRLTNKLKNTVQQQRSPTIAYSKPDINIYINKDNMIQKESSKENIKPLIYVKKKQPKSHSMPKNMKNAMLTFGKPFYPTEIKNKGSNLIEILSPVQPQQCNSFNSNLSLNVTKSQLEIQKNFWNQNILKNEGNEIGDNKKEDLFNTITKARSSKSFFPSYLTNNLIPSKIIKKERSAEGFKTISQSQSKSKSLKDDKSSQTRYGSEDIVSPIRDITKNPNSDEDDSVIELLSYSKCKNKLPQINNNLERYSKESLILKLVSIFSNKRKIIFYLIIKYFEDLPIKIFSDDDSNIESNSESNYKTNNEMIFRSPYQKFLEMQDKKNKQRKKLKISKEKLSREKTKNYLTKEINKEILKSIPQFKMGIKEYNAKNYDIGRNIPTVRHKSNGCKIKKEKKEIKINPKEDKLKLSKEKTSKTNKIPKVNKKENKNQKGENIISMNILEHYNLPFINDIIKQNRTDFIFEYYNEQRAKYQKEIKKIIFLQLFWKDKMKRRKIYK